VKQARFNTIEMFRCKIDQLDYQKLVITTGKCSALLFGRCTKVGQLAFERAQFQSVIFELFMSKTNKFDTMLT